MLSSTALRASLALSWAVGLGDKGKGAKYRRREGDGEGEDAEGEVQRMEKLVRREEEALEREKKFRRFLGWGLCVVLGLVGMVGAVIGGGGYVMRRGGGIERFVCSRWSCCAHVPSCCSGALLIMSFA